MYIFTAARSKGSPAHSHAPPPQHPSKHPSKGADRGCRHDSPCCHLHNKWPFFHRKFIILQGQFSIVSAFSIEHSRKKWPINVKYAVVPAPVTSNCKIGHFAIENHHFSGATLHCLCNFIGKFQKKVGICIAIRSTTADIRSTTDGGSGCSLQIAHQVAIFQHKIIIFPGNSL